MFDDVGLWIGEVVVQVVDVLWVDVDVVIVVVWCVFDMMDWFINYEKCLVFLIKFYVMFVVNEVCFQEIVCNEVGVVVGMVFFV